MVMGLVDTLVVKHVTADSNDIDVTDDGNVNAYDALPGVNTGVNGNDDDSDTNDDGAVTTIPRFVISGIDRIIATVKFPSRSDCNVNVAVPTIIDCTADGVFVACATVVVCTGIDPPDNLIPSSDVHVGLNVTLAYIYGTVAVYEYINGENGGVRMIVRLVIADADGTNN